MNSVSAGERIGQPPEQHHAASLPSHVPIGSSVERLATPVDSERAHPTQADRDFWLEDQVHPTDERQVAFLTPQPLHCQVSGEQRRGASRIELHGGAVQVKYVG